MTLADQLVEAVPDAVLERGEQKDKPLVVARPDGFHGLMEKAKELGFDHLACLTAVDWPAKEFETRAEMWEDDSDKGVPPEARGDGDDAGLMEVVYNLYAYGAKEHLAVQVWLPRVPLDQCKLASVADIWPGADWHERETYDMYGVTFTGHPDLKRIFMPDGWTGHPQRKDYDLTTEQFIYRDGGEDLVTLDPGKGW